MSKRYIVYYCWQEPKENHPPDKINQSVQMLIKDGQIISVFQEGMNGNETKLSFQDVLQIAKKERAILLVVETKDNTNHYSFYQF